MRALLSVFMYVLMGLGLLWFGYTLFFGPHGLFFAPPAKRSRGRRPKREGMPGERQCCPVCSAMLEPGELVKSTAFPSLTGEDRLMYIAGCGYCLGDTDRRRRCPVCGEYLRQDEILVARLFDRPGRSHVHVLGCSRCRPVSLKSRKLANKTSPVSPRGLTYSAR